MKTVNSTWIDIYRAERKLLAAAIETEECMKRLHLKNVSSQGNPYIGELLKTIRDLANKASCLDMILELTLAKFTGGDVFVVRELLEEG